MEITINKVVYNIEYKPQYSQRDYTRKLVYFIYTEEDNYCKAKRTIKDILEHLQGVSLYTKGEYIMKSKNNMREAMHPYMDFDYSESKDCYIATVVFPYDD